MLGCRPVVGSTGVEFIIEALVNDLLPLHVAELVIVAVNDQLCHVEAFKLVVVALHDEHVNTVVALAGDHGIVVPVESRLAHLLS